MPVEVKLEAKLILNTLAHTFHFKAKEPVHNFKQWYSDISMIGRHFLVYSQANP